MGRRQMDCLSVLLDLISFSVFFFFLFRLFRQQPGMDIESVGARAESGE